MTNMFAVADPEDDSSEATDTAFEVEHDLFYNEETMTPEAARDLLQTTWDDAIA